ncbi:hypothetical protein DL89DRAFT_265746 [Linderina pennispora]|uniref:Glutathione hydrolase n=1 Tax=Linderina pennispora TaxID=61395 RepID=A0A1Y1WEY0_9FUNG|nr:uncharacterized protein DL89DRAFT_265746 [Linderina pennispora]ORX72089.1 hypothetical protein DL89DRAFT_265746 [Linderina pennispora]
MEDLLWCGAHSSPSPFPPLLSPLLFSSQSQPQYIASPNKYTHMSVPSANTESSRLLHESSEPTALPIDDNGPAEQPQTRHRKHAALAYVGALIALIFVGGILAKAASFGDSDTRSTLVTARNGAVATDEPRCSKIGSQVLIDGGNAVDAAIASTLCIGILQAHSSGIGGGGFMLIRPSDGSAPVLIDFREAAGSAAKADMFLHNITLAQVGGLAVGVPGEIAGLHSAHKRFGKLPWKRLFEPSISLARKGYALSSVVYGQLKRLEAHVLSSPGFNTTYTDGRGHLLQPGDIVRRPELASTLEAIANHGPKAFYSGKLAQSMVNAIRENGGILTMEDFAAYAAVDRKPLETFYHGRRVITGSPPTSGSILLNMLNVVEGYPLAREGQTALSYHRIVEAMKFGAAQRTVLGDPSFVDVAANVSKQASKYFASDIRHNISDTHTFGVAHYDAEYDILNNHGTTHLSVLDSDGAAVALTSTVNLEFGSRIMDPVTGVILNDEMDDFSTTNQTNGFGLRPSPHNKIPTIIEHNGDVELVVGGSGGSRILTSVLQVIVNVFDFGMRLDNAIDTPRLHHQLLPHQLRPSISHALATSYVVQAVHRLHDGTIHAVSDARKHGLAAGY